MRYGYFSVLTFFVLLLTGCGGGPEKDFMSACKGSDVECKCMASHLEQHVTKKEFEALNQILIEAGEDVGKIIFSEGLVNDRVTQTFISGAKLCSSDS